MELIKAPNGWYCPDDPGELGIGGQRWSVSNHEGEFLSRIFKGLRVLEIGTGLGVSTNMIAKRAEIVYTVDIDVWVIDNIAPKLADNVRFYREIDNVPHGLDGAFIDGLHSTEQCLIDINKAKTIVKQGGIIVLHDAKMEAVLNAALESGILFYEIVTGAGLALGWNE